jgi:hypothetical protein
MCHDRRVYGPESRLPIHLLGRVLQGREALVCDGPVADVVVVNNAGVTGFETGPVAHDPEYARLKAWRDHTLAT